MKLPLFGDDSNLVEMSCLVLVPQCSPARGVDRTTALPEKETRASEPLAQPKFDLLSAALEPEQNRE